MLNDSIDISHSQEIFTVSRLNREIRFLLEGSFPPLWIEGEISNFVVPQSGHWYFSLKDQAAQVRCAMFKSQNRRLTFTPKDGMHVMVKAQISLYEGRGEYQLLVEIMEEQGVGQLQRQFEALKKRLSEAGIFDIAHKKPLPARPACIGVITSPTGAAIRDILNVLNRRSPATPVIIYPTLVQGSLAANQIVNAIKVANQRKECDLLILARGGGSLEDLWPFNEEVVAQAIFKSDLPIISGIGHEIDFTIADFVADMRAPTPSAAAELATPDNSELIQALSQQKTQMIRCIKRQLVQQNQALNWANKNLQQAHPKRKLKERAQTLDHFETTLIRLQLKKITDSKTLCQTLLAKLKGLTPGHRILRLDQSLLAHMKHLQSAMSQQLHYREQIFAKVAAKLNTLSPLATLKRGFAIATKADKTIIRSFSQVKEGERIHVTIADGQLDCVVKKNPV